MVSLYKGIGDYPALLLPEYTLSCTHTYMSVHQYFLNFKLYKYKSHSHKVGSNPHQKYLGPEVSHI